jgi:predicted ribosome quality control (RQC) complex YloA/Tae2 family protein
MKILITENQLNLIKMTKLAEKIISDYQSRFGKLDNELDLIIKDYNSLEKNNEQFKVETKRILEKLSGVEKENHNLYMSAYKELEQIPEKIYDLLDNPPDPEIDNLHSKIRAKISKTEENIEFDLKN